VALVGAQELFGAGRRRLVRRRKARRSAVARGHPRPARARDAYFARMEVTDAAFSTSGDYERYFISAGERYHHIIDPRTCHPAAPSRSATILAPTAMEAEFLTKGAFILGGEKGLAFAESWGAAAVLVSSNNQVLVSRSLRGKLEYSTPTP